MNVTITARHFKAPDKLKMFIENEINRLSKFNTNIIDCEVVLSYIKTSQNVEIVVKVKGQRLTGKAESDDIYKAFDIAMEKLERQLRKYKTKLQSFSHEKAVDFVGDNYFEEE